MNILKIDPGKSLQFLIDEGAPLPEIVQQVLDDAERKGVTGNVGLLLELPDMSEEVQEDPLPSRFVKLDDNYL